MFTLSSEQWQPNSFLIFVIYRFFLQIFSYFFFKFYLFCLLFLPCFACLLCSFAVASLLSELQAASIASTHYCYYFYTLFPFFPTHTLQPVAESPGTNESKRKVFRSRNPLPVSSFSFSLLLFSCSVQPNKRCQQRGLSWSRDRQQNKLLSGRSLAQVPGSAQQQQQRKSRRQTGRVPMFFRSRHEGSEPVWFLICLSTLGFRPSGNCRE